MARTRTLGAVLYPQFELLDLYGPLEMFGCLGEALRIVTIADRVGPVRSTPGPSTQAEYDYTSAPPLDLLVVPGGVGTFPQLKNAALLDFLRARAPQCEVAMSVCSGSALYAAAGLLEGKRATTNKQFFSMIAATGKTISEVDPSCSVLPLTFSVMGKVCGSGNSSAGNTQGPMGQNVSCHLPCNQSKKPSLSRFVRPGLGRNCRSEMSFTTVYPATYCKASASFTPWHVRPIITPNSNSQSMWSGETSGMRTASPGCVSVVNGGFMKT